MFAQCASSVPIKVLVQNASLTRATLPSLLLTLNRRVHELQHTVAKANAKLVRDKREADHRLSAAASESTAKLESKKQSKKERLSGHSGSSSALASASSASSTASGAAASLAGGSSSFLSGSAGGGGGERRASVKDLRREAKRELRRETRRKLLKGMSERERERFRAMEKEREREQRERRRRERGEDVAAVDLRSLLTNGLFALDRMPPSACPLLICKPKPQPSLVRGARAHSDPCLALAVWCVVRVQW